jgi:heme A synthase
MPIIKVIVVLAIIDAYTSPERRPRPLDVAAVLFSSATALGVEGTLGLLAPELALPGPVTLAAAGAGCVLLSTARAVVRPIQPTRRPPTRPSGMR